NASSLRRERKSARSCSSDDAAAARRRTCCKSDGTAFADMERPPEEKAFGISPYNVQPRRWGAQLFLPGASKRHSGHSFLLATHARPFDNPGLPRTARAAVGGYCY